MTQINFTISANVNGGQAISAAPSEAGNSDIYINTAFGAGTTNQSFTIAYTVANLQGIFLLASTNMTIKVNSSGSPAQTIDLIAGIPLYWEASAGYFANPLTANATVWYITCTASATLKGHITTL